jgi:hypothetical protein
MKKKWKLRIGLLLIVLSAFLIIPLLIIPFLGFNSKTWLTIATIIVITAEVMFWVGGILLGKELRSKFKTIFFPENWLKKKDKGNEQ